MADHSHNLPSRQHIISNINLVTTLKMRLRSKAKAEAAVVAEAAREMSAAAAVASAAAAAAAAAASAAADALFVAGIPEMKRIQEAAASSRAIVSAINHSPWITAISVQQSESLSLDERIELIMLQLGSGRYEGFLTQGRMRDLQSEVFSRAKMAELIAAEAASRADEFHSASVHIMFARVRYFWGPPTFRMKVFSYISPLEIGSRLIYAIFGVRRITGITLDYSSRMPNDRRIDLILFELARYEMNVMVAELNILLTIFTEAVEAITEAKTAAKTAAQTALDAVTLMVEELNDFVKTITSDPQSNATVILRLAIAAFRRIVLSFSHEMQLEEEALVMELSLFGVSAEDFISNLL